MMNKAEIADIYPLSPMQEALLFHSLYDQGDVYFEQMIFTLEGHVDAEALERSLNAVIARYDIFRTLFIYDKISKPRQIVLKKRLLHLELVNISNLNDKEQHDVIKEIAEEDRNRSFDLSKDMLLRLKLIQTHASGYKLIWSNHHILLDGWSLAIVLQEWFARYKQEVQGITVQLDRAVPYKTYMKWLESQDDAVARQYWRNYLSDYDGVTNLPTDRTINHTLNSSLDSFTAQKETGSIQDIVFKIDRSLTDRLVSLAREYQVTVSSLFQAIWGVVLQYYNNTDDVVFGSVVSGRSPTIPNVDKIVGLFINAVPIRIRSSRHERFSELLIRTHQNAALSEEHSFISLADMQVEAGKSSLFNHLLVYENYPSNTSMFDTNAFGLDFRITSIESFEHTNYDLNIAIGPGEEMLIKMNYNEHMYSSSYIERLYRHLEQVCLYVTGDPTTKVSDIVILTLQETELLHTFNQTSAHYAREYPLDILFAEKALLQPHHPAITMGNEQLTYQELNDRANHWANVLHQKGVLTGDAVGLIANRSIEMIVGILAILKAGAAYVPIDPSYPTERMTFMLHDSESRFLLALIDIDLPEFTGHTITFDDLHSSIPNSSANFRRKDGAGSSATSTAYIMYTSGSTGTPKGVMITHRNVAKIALNNGYIDLNRDDRILQISNYAFDGATFDIYGALLNGATLVLLDKEQLLNAESLAAAFEHQAISVAFLTTALFNTLVDWNPACFKNMRHVLIGGEKASVKHVNKALSVLGKGRLLNMYGPTEATVFTTCYPVTQEDVVLIGRPIHNSTTYVLNKYLKPLPIGVPGELYIGGEGLAQAYLGQPELTAERFIEHPFASHERLYRTGDLVKWLSDGNLEFLDRLDHQVKIRGHRIELGEVEAKLNSLPEVQDGLIMALRDEHGHSYLCAYIVPLSLSHVISEDNEDDAREWMSDQIQTWKKKLKAALPEYMVPTAFEILHAFPLTSNGKVDRKALPKPRFSAQKSNVAPSSATEQTLAKIWEELLDIAQIGAEDHFFELGGHSLKAMMLVSKIHKELSVKLSIQDIFQSPVLREMAEHVDGSQQCVYTPIATAPKQDTYPASSAQKRVFIAQQLAPSQTSYNMPIILEIKGRLDKNRLEQAFLQLISRHEALRTSFLWSGEELRQRIKDVECMNWQLDNYDLLKNGVGNQDHISQLLRSFIRPFDLYSGPLVRAAIATCNADRTILMIDIHHIVSDGVSTGIIYQDLVRLYQGDALPAATIHYKDFAVQEQKNRSSERYKASRDYWYDQFKGQLPEVNLITDRSRPAIRSYDGNTISFELDANMTNKLRDLASRHDATLYIVLLAAYNILLSKYSAQEDIVVGAPIAGRNHEDVQGIVGMFVNTLALRNDVSGKCRITDFIHNVKSRVMKAYEHGDYPLEELLEQLDQARDFSRHPLFDTLFVLQNMDIRPLELPGTTFQAVEWEWNHSKFDMTWGGRESSHGMNWTVEYATALFDPTTITRMIGHFKVILESMVTAPETLLEHVHMLTFEEKEQLALYNTTNATYPREASIMSIFEQQVVARPNHIALVYDDIHMTYAELNEHAEQLANVLLRSGINTGDKVGILAERSIEMIVAIWGILKIGAAYVPIDPAFPEERKRFVLENSEAACLVTTGEVSLSSFGGATLRLAELMQDVQNEAAHDAEMVAARARMNINPEDTAYIMYTSGSTGTPKGVVTTHQNIVKTSINNGFMEVRPADRMLQLSNYAFDGSTYDIFGALLNGATLVLIRKEDVLNAAQLARTFEEQRITFAFMTTALFNTLVDWDVTCLKHVSKLFFGGEAASKKHVMKALDYLGPNRIANAYGPTETTVFATTYTVDESIRERETVPIGRPIHNTQVYVLNRWGQQQPIGVPGELHIGGEGLAREYLNQPELTAERFIASPLVDGERLYRTGDLVRWLPNGNLEFLERMDRQVKIRGNRIELGEVEGKLLSLPEVREVVIVPGKDEQGHSYLAAYVVPAVPVDSAFSTGCTETERCTALEIMLRELRERLKPLLPEYMIPSSFVILESLPLTSNGKVDRGALPASQVRRVEQYTAPTNHIEQALASIWAEVLGHERVGIFDNFFALGGHSLKAMLLIAKVQHHFNVKLNLQDIFNFATIQELAARINDEAEHTFPSSILSAPFMDAYPASSAQRRLYVVQQYENVGTSYNMPMILRIEGELDLSRLEQAFILLIERHESLRTSFAMEEGEIWQRVHSAEELNWHLEIMDEKNEIQATSNDSRTESNRNWIASCIQPFHLSNHSLLRAAVRRLSTAEHLLFIDTHHIVSDGISTAILFDELFSLYNGEVLAPLSIQYKDYAVWEQTAQASERYLAEESYWLAQFKEEIPVLDLKLDGIRPRVQRYEGTQYTFQLDRELTSQLKQATVANKVTLFMILFSAYHILLAKYSGQEDIVVGTPIAGRDHVETNTLIGMFVKTLGLRCAPKAELSIEQYIGQVRDNVLEAYKHTLFPLEALIEKLDVPRDSSRHPLFDTLFVLQNMNKAQLELPSMQIHQVETPANRSKFDMTWAGAEHEDIIMMTIEYSTDLFSHSTIARMAGHFERIVQQMVERPEQQIKEIELMSQEEQLQLASFGGVSAPYPREATIPQLFTETVARQPDHPAVRFGTDEITYKELDVRSTFLAAALRQQGVRSGDAVGLLAERSMEMIVSIVGILKAGAAYVPLDPGFPPERLAFMLADSGVRLLLAEDVQVAPNFTGKVLPLDVQRWNSTTDAPATVATERGAEMVATRELRSEDIAYIMYTSGSTGTPKGVVTTHQNVVKTSINNGFMDVRPADRMLQLSNYAFDGSTYEIFGALLNGATLVLIRKEDMLNAAELARTFEEQRITSAFMTAALFNTLVDWDVTCLKHVSKLFFGGEAGSKKHVVKALDYLGPNRIANGYGPTETTVFAATYSVDNTIRECGTVPIGRPIHNTQVYVLNRWGQQQPIGVPGELHVGGEGLAREYLNQPELTAERFIASPFVAGERLYRTGDLVRWLPDGNLEFLERLDRQVKIRGNRIELGEVEDKLLSLPEVREVVVVPAKDEQGHSFLAAYLVPTVPTEPEHFTALEALLRTQLKPIVPDYMVPSSFIILDSMPLTTNGKIDRRALPAPHERVTIRYTAPTNEVEQQLASIWAEVLGLEQVGIYDHFFELGGHSLKAMTLIAKVHKMLDIRLSLHDVFANTSVYEQALLIQKEARDDRHAPLRPARVQATYPVSSAQKRLYMVQQVDRSGTSYNMPMVFEFESEIDRERMQEAFLALLDRHESLRTSFKVVQGELRQQIHSVLELNWNMKHDMFTGEPDDAVAVQDRIDNYLISFIRPFDLTGPSLLRAGMLTVSKMRHLLIIDIHHSVSDGVSTGIIFRELLQLYNGVVFEPLSVQYKDYAVQEQEQKNSEAYRQSECFWLEQFKGELPVLNFPYDFTRQSGKKCAGGQSELQLSAEFTERLNELAGRNGTTLYTLLLTAYSILLSKYSGDEDIIIGAPMAGRKHADTADIVGMFVHTMALRLAPRGEIQLQSYISEVRERLLHAFEHELYPLEELIEQLNLSRDPNRHPLFDTMFVLQNMELTSFEQSDMRIRQLRTTTQEPKFDMTWGGHETEKGLCLTVEYDRDLFAPATIERMQSHYYYILEQMVDRPEQNIKNIGLLTEEERVQLASFGGVSAPYPREATIPQLFTETVARQPDHPAVRFGTDEITYKELDVRSTFLAAALRQQGVRSGDAVGLLAERSMEMIVSIVGILKAGAAYVPLDPGFPPERLAFMLADSGARLLLAEEDQVAPNFLGKVLPLDVQRWNSTTDAPATVATERGAEMVATRELRSVDVAYIMYTSGSTGTPKGVVTTHQNVVKTSINNGFMDVRPADRMLQLSNYAFDGSTYEIFGALLNGATLVLIRKDDVLNAAELARTFEEQRITSAFMTAALFNTLVDWDVTCLKYVSKLFFGGEAGSKKHVVKALDYLGPNRIANGYGPTETTVFTATYTVDESIREQGTVPIGRPIHNTQVYVLNRWGQLQPIGVSGELYVGGEGLAREYLNQPELTAERFIASPFVAGERLYRTGDLVRWLPDGNLEFLERLDRQVKIRGNRIELSEVEDKLLSLPEVREVVVVPAKDEQEYSFLAAYIVVNEDGKDTGSSIFREHLNALLPRYMVPSVFVLLDSLPLTSNGKVDRNSLPQPSRKSDLEYMAPTNSVEVELVRIWEEVLKVDCVGIEDHFFEHGGHSLNAMMVTTLIQQRLHVRIDLQAVFENPTVKSLAGYVQSNMQSNPQDIYAVISPAAEQDVYPATPYQAYGYLASEGNTHWNMPMAFQIDGALHPERLQRSFQLLIARHEALRTSLEIQARQVVQRIHPVVHFELTREQAYSEAERVRIMTAFIEPFSSISPPLMRAKLLEVGWEKNVLLLDMHHAVSDGTSLGILLSELFQLYDGLELRPVPLQYKDYAVWQKDILDRGAFAESGSFWQQQLAGYQPFKLPTDGTQIDLQNYEGDSVVTKIPKQWLYNIKNELGDPMVTDFAVLYSIYLLLLHQITDETDLVVGTYAFGRQRPELQETVGLFINTIPLRNRITVEDSYAEFVQQVQKRLIKAFEHQQYPFEKMLEDAEVPFDIDKKPLFDTMFNLNNFTVRPVETTSLQVSPYPYDWKFSEYDLYVTAQYFADEFIVQFDYRTTLFLTKTMNTFANRYVSLFEHIARNPYSQIYTLDNMTIS
ncbi:non-ribosomal peptide synthetase [Paenibacillus sp. 481]|uniref:non-ribosomal peptide synthetase n=1 Tax=Paenibacillus sp. 481 TaxID=2835869 RepID=UPI001E5CA7AA|nr:non-ribosomal peptide synthetase [Paenibacillus sp. 481]UHA73332.1 amino acid adenylation domain-containing protein [Paenibacillus sp. 481]